MAIPDNSLTMVVQIGIFLGCLLATTPGAVGRKSSPIRLVKIGSWKYNENNGDIWGYMGFSIVVLVPQARWMVYSMGKSQSKIAKIDDDWGSPIPLGKPPYHDISIVATTTSRWFFGIFATSKKLKKSSPCDHRFRHLNHWVVFGVPNEQFNSWYQTYG